ncbi:hypothetical protein H5T88_09465 [bacterium]|nr:hypothetical protein [bacterium]
MPEVIFSFDDEDFITPEADEATEFWAKTLRERGIRGSFNLVGERARALRERGREDLIELLQFHEINYHSNFHSLHPTFPEYLEDLDWDKGVEEVIRREIKGLNDLREIFSQSPIAFMQPGNSATPQVLYAMYLLGMPIMEASFIHPLDGKLVWYCNTLNGLTWDFVFESHFYLDNRLEKMKESFKRLEEKQGLIVLGTHPCMLVTSEFWDSVNFSNGKNTPEEEYKPAPLRPKEFVLDLMRDIKEFLDWLRGRGDVEFITYRDVYERYKPSSEWISLEVLLRLAEGILDELNYKIVENRIFSASEIFSFFAWAISYYSSHKGFPNRIPYRRTIGPVEAMPSFKRGMKVGFEDFMKKCEEVNRYIIRHNRIPGKMRVNEMEVGAGSFAKAMAKCVLSLREGRNKGELSIEEGSDFPLIERELTLPHYEGTWLYPKGFKGERIIKLVRLQSWSAKPAL